MSKKAFITGGTGFIGINLIKLLVEEQWDITTLHRPDSNLDPLQGLPIAFAEGSVTDPESLKRAIPRGTDVIFHLAGDTSVWSKHNERQTRINVQGTTNMVKAAAESRVSTFIHTSSGAAWGDQAGFIDEETPQLGGDSWVNYERTKWAGEREALKGLDYGMRVVIINPSSVIGPQDESNWGRLFFALQDGTLPAIPNGSMSMGHVRHVAQAHISAAEHGKSGERYILGGVNCGFADLVKAIAFASGVAKIPYVVPAPLFKGYAKISALAASFTGREPKVTPEMARLMTRPPISFSSEKAKRELGYHIPPLQQSVNDCHDWLVKEGKL